MTPTISIVTCSYNQAAFLDTTIRSVVAQKIEGLEYFVVNGGSTDGSVDILRRHEIDLAGWVSEKDGGQSEAINKGLQRASGEVVGWLCSDDVLLDGALSEVLEFFARHPDVDAVYGDAVLIDGKGRPLRMKHEIGFMPWLLAFDHNYIPQPSMFWRRRVHEKIGYLREDLHLTMDLELWLRFARAGLKVAHVRRCWSGMRCHDSQKVFTQHDAIRSENAELRQHYGDAVTRMLPLPVVRALARATRVVTKGLQGGYVKSVPESVRLSLQRLHAVAGK
ncbi:glycosyltransferase family 2 protein [Methyloversatilis sp.]|uniref:glycosyltransferase family 2 protein n=1 Tax=Methyloversatilis sp. TaxID=2569862 RepID=UPI003D2B386C